jgi:hypothetical protein
MGDKINILFISASPRNAEGLRTDIELRAVDQAIRRALNRDRFAIATCLAARREDLQQALLDHDPHIVHFSGHAEVGSGLLLENEYQEAAPVGGAALAGLFAEFGKTIKIVFLNACHSRDTAEGFHQLIDYTIAMRDVISDTAATVFAKAFYQTLAYGKPPDVAFRLGINELRIQQIGEWGVPELLVRPRLLVSPQEPLVTEEKPRYEEGTVIKTNGGKHKFFFGPVDIKHGGK